MTIKAILFDLDNCLSAASEVDPRLVEPALQAIRDANEGTLSSDALEAAIAETWRHSFDFVAKTYGFSEKMRAAGWNAFASLEVPAPMRGYPDLPLLEELSVLRFLVTTGFRRLQESKIRALGITGRFTGIYIDAIDEAPRKGKEGIFREILAEHGLQPNEVLVVGDNPDSEIAAGNRLGIRTVQILRPGVQHDARAACHIRGLDELKAMLG